MLKDPRYRYLAVLLAGFLIIGILTRLLIIFSFPLEGAASSAGRLGIVFGLGALNDLICFLYSAGPLAALILLPRWGRRAGRPGPKSRAIAFGVLTLALGFWLFSAATEYFFWEEFGCRLNFIAVDYLIYTTELVRNIIESYPLPLILGGVFLSALILAWLIWRLAFKQSTPPAAWPRKRQALVVGGWLVILVLLQRHYNPPALSGNNLTNELSYNGLYQLFSAYRHNQLDYRQFYPTIDSRQALELLRRSLSEPNLAWDQRPGSLVRLVQAQTPERRLNVVQIVVESLGSDLLGENTPNLNALAEQSLNFLNLRATGTRTVRGIEALTLGVPPTPGSSIVRRPNNDNLFNLGRVFQSYGYEASFIYGGFGYFDNMNAFFSGNGFKVIDRYTMPKPEISFANVWGVCDEDLYRAALKSADQSFAESRNFYQFVLTTSNHRPFTYPEGKVALASGQGRAGAVQYTDYAIGRFLEEARSKPWFKDTVFVIVADHTAGAARKTVVPPENYLIPALVYSPEHIAPGRVETLCSQIDLPPTLFALLGFTYEGSFFGRDILSMPPEEGRAYLGTYQLLGFMDNNSLAVLSPNRGPEVNLLNSGHGEQFGEERQLVVDRAIAAYQTAQDFFNDGRLKYQYVRAAAPQLFLAGGIWKPGDLE